MTLRDQHIAVISDRFTSIRTGVVPLHLDTIEPDESMLEFASPEEVCPSLSCALQSINTQIDEFFGNMQEFV